MRTKSFDHPIKEVFRAIKVALNALKITIDEIDFEHQTIIGSTKTSFWSWGEEISIVLRESNHGTKVEVNSTSSSQLISWGKNEENEVNILEQIKIELNGK